MDLDMLELLLDEKQTYQNATKEIFLEKIKGVFEEFKSSGDINLIPIGGRCQSSSCNYGCSGFAFFGNYSKKRLPLILEENESDYVDIYYCSSFKTSPDSEVNSEIFLHISKDEKATFKPSIDYLLQANKCENALLDLEKYKGQTICKEVYTDWFNKHQKLFESLPGIFYDYKAFNKFSLFWYDLEDIITTLLYDSKALDALLDYDKICDDNEDQMLNWLLKYEDMGRHCALFLLNEEGLPYLHKPIPLDRLDELYIDQKDFLNYINFSTIYDKHYTLMLEKHNTFKDGKCPPEISHEDFYSLRYHLTKRALI